MDQIADTAQTQNLEGFNILYGATEVIGVVLVICVAIWTGSYRGGFSWRSHPDFQFNWHPLLMTIGLVFLYANAMLLYRTQRSVRKRRLKLLHAGAMVVVLVLTVIALVAVFDSHNYHNPPLPNMYSLHSWVGLSSVILFCLQWVAGFASFLFPGIQSHLRAAYMPVHVYFGTAGFVAVIASCLLGLNEKAIFSVPDYALKSSEGILINVIGLILVLFGSLTIYLVSQSRYKRLPRPEDDVLLTGRSQ